MGESKVVKSNVDELISSFESFITYFKALKDLLNPARISELDLQVFNIEPSV